MAFRFRESSNLAKLIIIAEFFLVSYLLYTLTLSVYKSYQIDIHIKDFEAQNQKIEDEIRRKTQDYEYYTSDAYVEKLAKQNLGLVNPGEKVIIIPHDQFEGAVDVKNSEGSSDFNYDELSNPEKWFRFFFDK